MSSNYDFKGLMENVYKVGDELDVISQNIDDLPTRFQFHSAQSVVAVGCGSGAMEILFLKRCMPNVGEFVGVEPEAESVAQLKLNLAEQMPAIGRVTVHQETAQTWRGVDRPVDAAFVFQCFYYLKSDERLALYRKLFDNVLHSGSYVLIVMHPYHNSGDSSPYYRLARLLNLFAKDEDYATDTDIRDGMTAAGFQLCYERTYVVHVNVENMDDTLLALFMTPFKQWDWTSARRAASEAFGDAKRIRFDSWLGIFKKP